MTTFLQRQHALVLASGQVDSLRDVPQAVWRLRDVLPKYTLSLADGKMIAGYFRIAAAANSTFDLPPEYTPGARLCGIIIVDAKAKLVMVSPTFGTNTYVLYGTNGTTKGNHRGIYEFCCDTTSINIAIPSVPNGGEDTLVEHAFWELPDLSLAASWRDGPIALGVDS